MRDRGTQHPKELTDSERRSLRSVVAHMIPASGVYDVPGADDDIIFADIVASLDREADAIHAAIACLDELAGSPFHTLAPDRQQTILASFRRQHPGSATAFTTVTVRCYYRDDRVMRSLGMELRPPFPKGFDVKQGDWSLLEPVRARGRIYRETT